MWNTDSESESCEDAPEEFIVDDEAPNDEYRSLIQWLLIFITSFQSFYHLTDHAVEGLYSFIKAFLRVLGSICSACKQLSSVMPGTLNKTRKLLGYTSKFHKYVTCKQCFSVYSLVDCVEKVGSRHVSKPCSYIPFGKRTKCNAPLLKTVELASKKKVFYPLMTYCYIDMHNALQTLLYRDHFYDQCQQWKLRKNSEGLLNDIYDSQVWKKFERDGFF